MKAKILDSGTNSVGVGILDPSNANFNELYQNPAMGIQRFMSKVRGLGAYKDDVVRVSIWADSIFNNITVAFQTHLEETFPSKTFVFVHAHIGGTGANYQSSMVWEIINFNPDLIIIEEWEGFHLADMMETLISKIREKTTADLLFFPFPIGGDDMDKLIAGNITSYKESNSHQVRKWFYAMRAKYGGGMWDTDLQLIQDLLDGSETRIDNTDDGTHRTDYSRAKYVTPSINALFADLYLNEYLGTFHNNWLTIHRLVDIVQLPDLVDYVTTGSFASNVVSSNVTTIQTLDGTIEIPFDGIGVEITHWGDAVGVFSVEIDTLSPSTLLKDYATCARDYLTGLHKIIVNTNILSNDEIEREFSVVMSSATEYTLRDVTNSLDIRTGVITNDEVFAVTGGQLEIPANYAGINNWRGTIEAAQVYLFSVKKNWYDSITIAADGLSKTTRVFGLERKSHVLKISWVSGVVNLDQILVLK